MLINNYLKENNITKYQFAKACDLPYSTLSDICSGKTDIIKCTGETLLKLATILKCSVDDLLIEGIETSIYNINRIEKLIKPIAKKYNLHNVFVFGSYARGEATKDSDIDILIDREGSKIKSIIDMSALTEELKEVLKKDVDLITVQSLNQKSTKENNKEFINNVMKDRIKIYG